MQFLQIPHEYITETTGGSVMANDLYTPWMQVIAQLGALGVLMGLAWQVPKLLAALRTWRDEAERNHKEERAQMRQDNKENLQAVLHHCEETANRRDANMMAMQKEIENIQEALMTFTKRPRSKWLPDPANKPPDPPPNPK